MLQKQSNGKIKKSKEARAGGVLLAVFLTSSRSVEGSSKPVAAAISIIEVPIGFAKSVSFSPAEGEQGCLQ